MGASVLLDVPCSKGAVCYCLDEFSKGRGARARVKKLKDAVDAIAPSYAGLADVFGKFLLPYVYKNAAERQKIVAHLQNYWFDPNAPYPYFPDQPVAKIYGDGLSKALELSLGGRRVLPLNSWWILDSTAFRLLTLADVDPHGVTVGGNVTLLILTPRPQHEGKPTKTALLGTEAQAWVTQQGLAAPHLVLTRPVRDIQQ
jgi:hypothetical protein